MSEAYDEDPHEGGCLCGEIRYRLKRRPTDVGHCHCSMCQRSSGALFVTWATVPLTEFELLQGDPATYRSSPNAKRLHCGDCGTQLFFHVDEERRIDVTVATLDEPDRVEAVRNIWVDTRRAAAKGFDRDLPDYVDEGPEPDGP
ncbi:GFA family protein [Prosthecomicrobium sp. N25]|uniref:GFA family protein n=1 Tax=Prosthecomicrobium sp. N25 TaxID=3129254 RepID=UPI0030777ED3